MVNNSELELITSVCHNKDISTVMQGHSVDEMFTAYKDVWDFVKGHYVQYRSVPDIDVVRRNFDEIDDAPVSGPTQYYLDKLRENYVAGRMRTLMLKASDSLEKNGAQKTYERFFTELSKLGQYTTAVNDVDLADFDLAEKAFIDARERAQAMGGVPGIATGFKPFDLAYKTGAAPGHLIVLFGYTGRMKSFFSALWAVNAFNQGFRPMVISLEMNPDEYRNRTYAMMNPGKFSINDMFSGDVNMDDMREWAARYFEDKKGFIVPSMSGMLTVTPNIIGAKIDQHKPDLVILDYAQLLMDNEQSTDMTKRMLNLTNQLKALAQAKQVPIILISSVTDEAGDKREEAPILKQVAWSRGIEYNANLAVAVHKHEGTDGEAVVEIACRKNRNGPEFNFGLRANPDKGVFEVDYDF